MRNFPRQAAAGESLLELAKKELAVEPGDVAAAGRERDAYYACDGEDKRDLLDVLFRHRDD